MDFELHRKDIHQTRFLHNDAPPPADGQALLRIESFGLTSNNITYAVLGDAMNYWSFFPASDPQWASLNVWGFAQVEQSRHPDLARGHPGVWLFPLRQSLVGGARPHRRPRFRRRHTASTQSARGVSGLSQCGDRPAVLGGPGGCADSVLPAVRHFVLIDDFLADENFFGARTVVISSASSKTAIIAAYLLSQRGGVEVVGLTSAGNREFVEGLGIYDSVVLYEDISTLPQQRAVYIDIAGDSAVRGAIHAHYGDQLAHSATVGVTHWTQAGPGDGELAGPSPVFFFAPDRIAKRGADWGPAKFDQNVADAWAPFVDWVSGWLQVEKISGEADIKAAYLELLGGTVYLRAGTVVEL